MTIETAPPELLDLALELFYADEADTLDQALALAVDLEPTLRPYAEAWDAQARPAEDEVIADYHDIKRRAQQWLEGYRHGLGIDL